MSQSGTTNLLTRSILFCILFASCPAASFSQDDSGLYETSLFLNIPQAGSMEISALISPDGVYIPVDQVFSFLRIRYYSTPGMDSIAGYINDPDHSFTIDRTRYTISYEERSVKADTGDLILTASHLYMHTDLYKSVFGLELLFNMRSLSLTLNTQVELPVIRLLRQEQMRKNLARIEGSIEVDTTVGQQYPLFHFGMIDWSLLATQIINGPTTWHGILSLGAVLLGGETNVTLRYNSNQPFTEKQQYYLWHLVNNDFRFLRQVKAGKITPEKTVSIYDPIVGAEFTNTPTTFRRSFCSYTLSDYTEPGWIVELYVNHVLIAYTEADASGFFLFEVPLVYGNTSVTLRFYGPYGEERLQEKNITIPINFLPPGEFEYSVSGGMVEDERNSIFARGSFRYGVGQRITIGAGTEYLSSLPSGRNMPFVNLALRIGSRMLVTGEYMYGVRFRGMVNYMHRSNFRIEAQYTRYHHHQQAVNTFILEERKVAVSMPFQRKKIGMFFRFTYNQIILPHTGSIHLEFLASGNFFGISTNITTFALFPKHFNASLFSNVSLGIRFPKGFIVTPQFQYEYTRSRFTSVKVELQKNIGKYCAATVSYENNLTGKLWLVQAGLRVDLPFAQISGTVRAGDKSIAVSEYARGSMLFDPGTGYTGFGYRTSVGRGGIAVTPFLDLNHNKIWDEGEPRANGINILTASNRIKQNKKDSTIHILDLEPYTDYYLEIDPASFSNIAWQVEQPRIKVFVEPNMFTQVRVPVSVMGEVSGFVYLVDEGEETGTGRVLIRFFTADSTLAGETVSEPDGYFSFMRLPPGSYYATLSPYQMDRIRGIAFPTAHSFVLNPLPEGDVVDQLLFYIHRKP